MATSPLILQGMINAEIAGNYRFRRYSTDPEIAELITYARKLGLDDELTHDLICTANRKGKHIPMAVMKKQMQDYVMVVRPRGYPFGFHNLQAFQQFQTATQSLLQSLRIPALSIRVHGSSLRKPDAQDLDLLCIADAAGFHAYQVLVSPQRKAQVNTSLLDLAKNHHLAAIDFLLVEEGTYFPNRPYMDFFR
jgi:hypothetical protein